MQATALVGCAMTYTLFEYAKDNLDELMPDNLLHSSTVQVFASFTYCFSGLDYIFYIGNVRFHCDASTHMDQKMVPFYFTISLAEVDQY